LPYTIKQISQKTGLPASTLRYYDSQGLLPELKRDNNNIRVFTDNDISSIKLINCLKRSGLSIRDIKNFLDMLREGDGTLNERLAIFHNRRDILREELKNLQEVLNVIEYKCWFYERACEAGTTSGIKESDIPEKFRSARDILHKII